MKRFLKNLAKSFLLAGLTGCITMVLCALILSLGGTEHALKHIPEVAKTIVLFTLIILWPVFFGGVLVLKPASEESEQEDDWEEDISLREGDGGGGSHLAFSMPSDIDSDIE